MNDRRGWRVAAKVAMVAAALACAMAAAGTVVFSAAQQAAAQSSSVRAASADALLGAALHEEEVSGQLDAAIATYRKVLAAADATRAQKARAQFRIGACYEKLGAAQGTEARKAYEAVVAAYGDQGDLAAQAKARLGAMAGAAPASSASNGPSYRKLWTAPKEATLERVSPDGRYVGYVKWDDAGMKSVIVVHDLSAGTDRQITANDDVDAEGLAFSRDSRQVAFCWYENKSKRAELRVASLSGTGIPDPRRIMSGADIRWIQPYDWTPDASVIAISIQRADRAYEIGLVSLADGSVRTLKTGIAEYVTNMALSPDGRYLAFDLDEFGMRVRDIAVVDTRDGHEVGRIANRADDALVGWTRDGSRLAFTSNRTGSKGLWMQSFAGGTLAGVPEIVRNDIGQTHWLGIGPSGQFYSATDNNVRGDSEVRTGVLDTSAGVWVSAPVDAWSELFPDSESAPAYQASPSWSPDGSQFTVIAGRDPQGSYLAVPKILVHSKDTGASRLLRAKVSVLLGILLWAPDGSALVGSGRGLDGRWGIWRIDAKTGEASSLALGADDGGSLAFFLGWSRDGKRIHFTRATSTQGQVVMEKDLTTGTERELVACGATSFAGFSPDGLTLYHRPCAAADDKAATVESAIMARDLATGAERTLVRRRFSNSVMRVSPDGRVIAAVVHDEKASTDSILLVPVDGGAAREVLPMRRRPAAAGQPGGAEPPALGLFWFGWAPDSRSILVEKRAGGTAGPETWWVPVDDREPRRLETGTSAEAMFVRWHPDGRRLAMLLTSQRAAFKPYEVWVLENVLPPAKK